MCSVSKRYIMLEMFRVEHVLTFVLSYLTCTQILQPNPRTEKQEWARIYDFLSFHPESLHMLTFLLDDVGIPKDYMHMPGFGVHTFVFVNPHGKRTLVKFHWVPEQPIESISDAKEAVRIGGEDFSHATHALIDSIEAGHYPAWKLCVQLMDSKLEQTYSWGDPLDAAKTWPEDEFPLIEVGRMVLNRAVDNLFLESEQIAFSPGLVVPGITYSADKLLQSRLFSYSDTQRYRIGANYLQLPINAPRCPFFNGHYDGAMNSMHRQGDINYFPSTRVGTKHAAESNAPADTEIEGVPQRTTIRNENNFQQPGERWRSFDADRQQRFVDRVVESLNEAGVTKQLKATWIGYWTKCDRDLGARIAKRVRTCNM
jgi:catalase